MTRSISLLPLIVAAVVVSSTPACTAVLYPERPVMGDRDDRGFYNRGVAEGREDGREDARRGRSYDVRRHDEYRQNRRGDDRGDLRAYRQGFEAGYREGYRQAEGPIAGGPINGRIATPAAETGYRDGLEEGRRAARDRDRYDPIRERLYRDGDHAYDRRYGSLDEYKRAYRDAFRRGYDVGYRGRER